MGGQVGISGHLSVNDNVQIGAQSGVTKNISKNSIVSGTPSVNLKTYLKQAVMLKQMVEKMKNIIDIEKIISMMPHRYPFLLIR